jgi:L-ascorbate metabolism protein UlaG (beta-lactamase superfamily)
MTRQGSAVRLRYLGGPTQLIEYGRLRLLVDPTFDDAGDHPIGERVLTKTADAAGLADRLRLLAHSEWWAVPDTETN